MGGREALGSRHQIHQARRIPALAAALLNLGIELIHQSGDRQACAIALRLSQADPEILAHPIDGEAEVELALDHRVGRGSPSARTAPHLSR